MSYQSKHDPKKYLKHNWYIDAVKRELGSIRLSRALISYVRHGKRKNDTVLMAIIKVEHERQHNG